MIAARAPVRVELVQWFGLLGGAAAWTVQHLALFALAVAACNPGSGRWGIDAQTWKIVLTAGTATLAAAAEAAAVATWLRTRGTEESEGPPRGRIHFFALCAIAGNVLFLGAIALDGAGSLYWHPCFQS